MRRSCTLAFLIMLPLMAHAADVYVGPSALGSGNCSSFANRCTVATGYASLVSGTANIIHYDTAIYTSGFDITKSGGSPSARMTHQCDAGLTSATVAIGKCQVTGTISFAATGIFVEANNVDVFGFDVGNNPNMGAGILGANANSSVHINGNYVHDLAQNVFNTAHSTPPGAGCPENGAVGAGSVDIQTNGNFVKNFGHWPRDPNCRVSQGIYVLDGQVYNNIVAGVPTGAVQIANACGSQVSNNTLISAAFGVIIENNNGCAGRNTVANNYIANISSGGNPVLFLSNTQKCTTANPNLFSHNIWDASVVAFFSAGPFPCDTVTPNPPLTQVGSLFVVNYQINGTGDYHLKAASAGIGNGASGCTTNTPSCVPSRDFDGVARPSGGVQDVGAYVFVSSGVPLVSFSPSPLNFGTVPVSTSATLSTTLTNTGTANLTFSAATITGANAAVFSIVSTTCASPLVSGASCGYNIRATPSASGAQIASLTLSDNASGSPHQVPLNVTGGTAGITLSPTSLNFGTITPGSCSAGLTVNIISSGSAPLVIQGAFTFSNPLFSFASGGTCTVGQSLAAGQSCTAAVKFCPTVGGAQSGNMSIPTNAPGSPALLPLTGSGGTTSATLIPTTFNYGNQQVGTSSTAQAFTYTNTGTLALTITAVTVNSSSYSVTDNCPRGPSTLAPSASCATNVVFRPTATGVASGVLTVTAGAGTQTSALSGTGTNPNIVLNPTTVSFGNALIGTTTASTAVTITNNGGASATIGSVTVSAQFGVTHNCGSTLAAGASCTANVTFSPTSIGLKSGQLTVADNAPGNPHTAALSGTGTAPIASLTPASNNYGSQAVGSTTAPVTYTLSNTGTGPMTFSIALTGTNPGDYVLGTTTCTSPLQGGTSCTIPVSFKPTTSGSRTATLQVTDSAPGSPHTSALSGTGVTTAPAVCLNRSSINFGNQPVGTTSGTQSVVVTNCGTASLTVSSVSASSNFTAATTCGTVAVGATCNVNIAFAPSTAGTLTGTVNINSNAASTPDVVTTSGFGTQAGASLTPSSVNFGTVVVGQQSAGTLLTLTNVGNVTLTVNTPTFTGTNASDFTFTGSCPTLAVNASCQYSVFATPGGAGSRTGTFNQTFGNGVTANTVSLTVTGQATAPAVTLTPSSINFGSVTQGTSTPVVTIQLTNSGTANLTVTSVTATGTNSGDVTLSADNCTGATVTPGAVCTVGAAMTPASTGARSANAHFITNAASSPNDVPLSVIGLVAPAPQATFTPTTLAFGTIKTGQTSQARTVTVGNIGNANLIVSSVTLGGANPTQYSQTNNCDTVIPNATCTVSVNFSPTTIGSKPATVVIVSNDGTNPTETITLSGTGKGHPHSVIGVTAVNFGSTIVGTTSGPAVFTITNTGDDTLNVSTITTAGDTFPQTNTCTCCPVAPGSSCAVSVQFNPQILCGQFDPSSATCTSNVHLGNLSVVSDADQSPQAVALSGLAVPVPPPPGPITVVIGSNAKIGGNAVIGVQ